MKKLLLLLVSITFSSMLFSQECFEIFISEYVEGWSNNKAIELYNPTNNTIDLSNYQLKRYSNGSTSAGAQKVLTLTGIMPPLSVYVIVIDKRDSTGTGQNAPVWAELQAKADIFECPIYDENNVMYFNGNDAVILYSLDFDLVIDRLGKIGENPGEEGTGADAEGGWNNVPPDFIWAANGATGWTLNHSLIRKPNIVTGDFFPTATFDVSEQWDSIPPVIINDDGFLVGNWASLGSHTCDCGNVVGLNELDILEVKISPNPSAFGKVTIVSKEVISEIVIYSINGAMVQKIDAIKNKSIELNTSDYIPGIYLINMRFDNGYVTSKRLIIE
jgi:hypothetical protein